MAIEPKMSDLRKTETMASGPEPLECQYIAVANLSQCADLKVWSKSHYQLLLTLLQKAAYMDHWVLALCRCVCVSEVSVAYFR